MGNYENLKQSITEVIRTNGNQEITGAVLQSTLLTIISTVGANATFAGIATPTTNPGTPDGPVFYLASESGTYTNFNAIELQDGLSVLMWNGSWNSQQIFSIDNEPTAGSDNLVKSGGVAEELALGAVYDVSAKNPTAGVNNDGKFESLSALLEDANLGTLIPISVRKGGMSIKFVQSSDNKYVQYRLTSDSFNTNITNWQKVDDAYKMIEELDSNILRGSFVRGSLTDGVLQPDINYRIATDEILSYNRDIQLTASSTFRFGIHYFVNGVFDRDSGWINTVKLEKGTTFKIVISRQDASEHSTANISEFLSNVYVSNIIDYVDDIDIALGKTSISGNRPTRNGSWNNPDNQYAVVWLDIPCAGCSKIRFRVNKTFATAGNVYMFCYSLPNGSYRDKLAEDYSKGFYQDSLEKWLELDVQGLSTFTIQAYETSLPFSYPSTFSPLRMENFIGSDCLEFYFVKSNGLINTLSTKTELNSIKTELNEFKTSSQVLWEHSMSRIIEGKGQTFSDTYLYGLQPSKTYILHLAKTTWDITGVQSGNRLAITSWYGSGETRLFQYYEIFPDKRDIKFTIPANSDYIAIGGRAAVGEDISYYVTEDIIMPKQEQMIVHKKKVTNSCGNQGLTIVGNTIVQFNSAADDHSTYSNVLRWNRNNFTSISGMEHNLGHAATIDYNDEVDALVVGNGTSDTSVAPRLDIVLDASTKIANGGQLSYNSADILHIELKTNIKEIGGSGLICCYGGNWREVFLATGQNAPRKIFRCILGVGNEDFSDDSVGQDDVTKWGTFISGKADSEYNGTLKVVATYEGDETEVYQGMCYRAGFIYLACGYTEPLIHKIRLCVGGNYEIVQTNMPQSFAPDGTMVSVEPEGLCFYDATSMLVGLPLYGGLFKIDSF